MAGNLTTIANALQWVGQTSDPQDLVARLVAAASTAIQNWLGYQVAPQTSYTRIFDGQGTYKLFVPDLPLVSVQSLIIDNVTIPQGVVSGGAQQAGYYNNANAIGLKGYYFHRGFQNITASYTAGRAAVPPDLEQACLDWVKLSLSNQQLPGIGSNVVSVHAGDTDINFGGKGSVTDINLVPMPSSIFIVLQSYRRVAQIPGF
jgi:hypothetical protein